MAFSSGTFSRLYNWTTDKANNVKIRADRMDAELDGIATALSTCILKDGTQTVTATIPWNSQGLTGVGNLTVTGSTASTNTTTGAVVVTGGVGVGGALNIGGALGVTGATTLSSALTYGGVTLSNSVTGTGSMALSASPTFTGTLGANKIQTTAQPCFRAAKSGNQGSIANQTATKVTFTSETYDIGSYYDAANSKWTPPAGLVCISTGLYATGVSLGASSPMAIAVYKNLSPLNQLTWAGGVSTFSGNNLFLIDRANGTDYYEVYFYGTTGSSLTIDATASSTYFEGVAL